jgi:hypothetical protein
MNYLLQVAKHRPMLRVTGQVLLAFCCAAPLVLALSSFVAYGLHSLTHWTMTDGRSARFFSSTCAVAL